MSEIEQKAAIAISAIEKLNSLNEKFIADLEVAAKRASKIGTLSVSSSAISCVCLDRSVTGT